MPVENRVGDLQGNDLSHRKTSEMTATKIAADSDSVDHFRQMHTGHKGRPEAAQSSGILYQMPSSWLLGCIKSLAKGLGPQHEYTPTNKSTSTYIAKSSIPELCVLSWFVS